MDDTKVVTSSDGRDLLLSSSIYAAPQQVFRAWTDPDLLRQWFAPAPFTTPVVETDPRPGGSSLIVMRAPDGNEFPSRGVYLEVIENQRLVFTDAFAQAWEPSAKPFMVVELTFADRDGRTDYNVRVRHWTVADREQHEAMGFHQGWALCTRQLATLVESSTLTAQRS